MLSKVVENTSFSAKFLTSLAGVCPATCVGEKTTTTGKHKTQKNLLSEYILHTETIVFMG